MKTLLALLLALTTSAQAASLTLTWVGVPNATAYRLFQAVGTNAFAWLNTYSGTTATVGVDTNAVTRFYVTSFDATGKYLESKPSNTVTNTPSAPVQLDPPTNLRATQVQGNRLDLNWDSALTVSTEVERSTMSAPFEHIGTTPPGTLHYTTQIKKKTDYQFRVRSFSGVSLSPYSTPVYVYWQ